MQWMIFRMINKTKKSIMDKIAIKKAPQVHFLIKPAGLLEQQRKRWGKEYFNLLKKRV